MSEVRNRINCIKPIIVTADLTVKKPMYTSTLWMYSISNSFSKSACDYLNESSSSSFIGLNSDTKEVYFLKNISDIFQYSF